MPIRKPSRFRRPDDEERDPSPAEGEPEWTPEELAPPEAEVDAAALDDSPEAGEEEPQRFASNGVEKDMGTVAVHPSTHAGGSIAAPAVGPLPQGGWAALSDAEIMLRVAAGDDSGFGLLVEKYRRQMVHFMYRMVHNQAVAEELAQEVFLRVYRARASYRAEAKFSTWLYRIATNLGVNHARDTRHERGAQAVYLDQPDPETGVSPDVADSRPTVEQEMMRDARMAAIRKHVMALPERQRTAVVMHKYQEMDYKQIGAVLKLSESATKSLLFRAYQTLRERLQEFV